jgi:anti-sigma regulatory factor (Ser/Thr protein kinase)
MKTHTAIHVTESSQASQVRLDVRALAGKAGFAEVDVHRAGLVATELASNLVKHASGGGYVLMRISGTTPGEVELIAFDRGPGIRDLPRAMADGHSTAGSPGTGLGAIRRLSDDFDISSAAGRGTVIFARLRGRRAARPGAKIFDVGAVSVAMPGEQLCGDSWHVRQHSSGASLLVADGLGHGILANAASEAAVAAFDRQPLTDTARALESIHDAIRHTRGAAAAIANLQPDQHVVRFSGVGNISAAVCQNGAVRQAVSAHGTLGHLARQFREYSYPWSADAIFVMHSDGLSGRWSLDDWPGLRQRHPVVIATVLYRDFSRSTDDATVVVAREAA